jgi:hypothetical protein
MNKKFLSLLFPLIFLRAGLLFSLDYGGVLSQNLLLENSGAHGGGADLSCGTALNPWVSLVLGNDFFLYLSASFTGQYELEEWKPVLEADRFELTWRPKGNIFAEAGRFAYTDPLGIMAAGLFDGAAVSLGLGENRLSLGAFYTGLLYKKTANITMSGRDLMDYAEGDHYWAPPRRVKTSPFFSMQAGSGPT